METNIINDLNYLRNLSKIIIPTAYTLWLHNTNYKPIEKCTELEKSRCWHTIPTEDFVVLKELSCASLRQWFQSVAEGHQASYEYSVYNEVIPFQIRIVQPKTNCLDKLVNKENLKRRKDELYGLGDGRHPKVSGGTKIYLFACTNKKKSLKTPDIVYGVREEDLHIFRLAIEEMLSTHKVYKYGYGIDVDKKTKSVTENGEPIILPGNGDFSRFLRVNGRAPYEQEYYDTFDQNNI